MAEITHHRSIVERLVITGDLMLETPAHFGSGDADALTDMPLIRDELDGAPLLPGTSIAGALRNYLRERQAGYEAAHPAFNDAGAAELERLRWATLLFGGFRGDPLGRQSPLIVFDACLEGNFGGEELRDGVKIDPETRTAEEHKKYDIQLLPAGSRFKLRFELLISAQADADKLPSRTTLLEALATALDGLERGEIGLGMRKRRGFGRCRVDQWTVTRYDLKNNRAELLAWLAEDHPGWAMPVPARTAVHITEALGVEPAQEDARRYFEIKARLAIASALLIRSGFGESDSGPDVVHLHGMHADAQHPQAERRPLLPGTSLAGALRARARRIVLTLAGRQDQGPDDHTIALIEETFGPEDVDAGDETFASRLEVAESAIQGGYSLVQNRIKIDRFTGGAAETALFEEQPLFAGEHSLVELHLRLRNPRAAQIGLLLLLLKDLWTGDLTLGGEASVGRGRLHGLSADLELSDVGKWHLEEKEGSLALPPDANALQAYVDALVEEVTHDPAD